MISVRYYSNITGKLRIIIWHSYEVATTSLLQGCSLVWIINRIRKCYPKLLEGLAWDGRHSYAALYSHSFYSLLVFFDIFYELLVIVICDGGCFHFSDVRFIVLVYFLWITYKSHVLIVVDFLCQIYVLLFLFAFCNRRLLMVVVYFWIYVCIS